MDAPMCKLCRSRHWLAQPHAKQPNNVPRDTSHVSSGDEKKPNRLLKARVPKPSHARTGLLQDPPHGVSEGLAVKAQGGLRAPEEARAAEAPLSWDDRERKLGLRR